MSKFLLEGRLMIMNFEGIHDENPNKPGLQPMMDIGGIWTAGYGRVLRDTNGRKLEGEDDRARVAELYPNDISIAQAERWLDQDITKVENQLQPILTMDLNPNQYTALVSLVYNIGVGNFSSSTLLKKLRQQDLKGASKEFTKWVYVRKKKVAGLKNRRLQEQALFNRPVFKPVKPLSKSRTIKGAALGSSVAAASIVHEVSNNVDVRSMTADTWVGVTVAIISIAAFAWVTYARVTDRKEGLR